MSDPRVWPFVEEARQAEKDIAEAGQTVYLIKQPVLSVNRDGAAVNAPTESYGFPALLRSYSDKDWADSKIENFYAIQASDRYLIGAAYTLRFGYENPVRPEAGDLIHCEVFGRMEEFQIIRVQTIDLDGWPILFRQIQMRGARSTNKSGPPVSIG